MMSDRDFTVSISINIPEDDIKKYSQMNDNEKTAYEHELVQQMIYNLRIAEVMYICKEADLYGKE